MEKLKNLVGISQLEKDSAQAFFILIFLGPLGVNAWRSLLLYREISMMLLWYVFAMTAFSFFVYYSSIRELAINRKLLNIRGLGFAILYFSGIILAYGLILTVFGNVPARFVSAQIPWLHAVIYLKYAAYFFVIAAMFLVAGEILENRGFRRSR